MRKLHRLHLKVLLLRPSYPNPNGFHITVLSTSILFAQSITRAGPLVRILLMIHSPELRHYFFRDYLVRTVFLLVDLAGFEPAS